MTMATPTLKTLTSTEYKYIVREMQNKIYYANIDYSKPLLVFDSVKAHTEVIFISATRTDRETSITKLGGLLGVSMNTNSDYSKTEFVYKEFKVTLLIVDYKHAEFYYNYSSYSGACEIFKPIVEKMGLILNETGLYLPLLKEDSTIHKICLTTNWSEFMDFIGCRTYYWTYAFNNAEQLFNEIVHSSYFDKDLYLSANPDYKTVTGENALNISHKFLQYIDQGSIKSTYVFKEPDREKSPWIKSLKEMWPSVVKDYQSLTEEITINSMIKKKFNYANTKELTGYNEITLFKFVEHYKQSFKSKGKFEQFVLSSTKDTLHNSIKSHKEVFEKLSKQLLAEENRCIAEEIRKEKLAEATSLKQMPMTKKEEDELVNKSPKKKSQDVDYPF